VEAAGCDFDPLVGATFPGNPIDQPMIACDAARPPTCKIALQRLRLAEADEWATARVFDQIVDLPQYRLIVPQPVLVVLPRNVGEMDIHLVGGTVAFVKRRSLVAPASAARIDRSNRSAFAGLLNR
jgi:hypothetical protein